MSDNNGRKSNTLLIVVVIIFFVLLVSSGFGFFGYTQGWFGGSSSSNFTLPPLPVADTSSDTSSDSSTIQYQGLSTACATSYKVSQDQFNTAIPPFDPSKCQGVEIESNCQTWTPVQQGTTWVWQKTAAIDGCVPVQPDTVGVAKGVTYVTDAGVVTPTTSAMAASKDPSGTSMASGGGYGKDGTWRNAEDSQQIVAVARSGKTRSSTRTTSKTSKPAAKKSTPTPTKTRSNSDPAPLLSTPAYADAAPFTQGMVSYSLL